MLKKSIYKITNIINNKCYIGQTTDPTRRWREHKSQGYGQEKNKKLYYAFSKYGIENFTFEILEENIENYNEREKYWIRYYDSYENGYNMTEGGEEPPLNIKEKSPFAQHSQEEVDKVIDLIQNTNIPLKEIAEMSGYDYSTIKRIQSGKLWHNDKLSYPLRRVTSRVYQKERALLIINDLLNTDLTQYAIAEKYDCARTTVTAINNGDNYRQDNLTYPLRKKY